MELPTPAHNQTTTADHHAGPQPTGPQPTKAVGGSHAHPIYSKIYAVAFQSWGYDGDTDAKPWLLEIDKRIKNNELTNAQGATLAEILFIKDSTIATWRNAQRDLPEDSRLENLDIWHSEEAVAHAPAQLEQQAIKAGEKDQHGNDLVPQPYRPARPAVEAKPALPGGLRKAIEDRFTIKLTKEHARMAVERLKIQPRTHLPTAGH